MNELFATIMLHFTGIYASAGCAIYRADVCAALTLNNAAACKTLREGSRRVPMEVREAVAVLKNEGFDVDVLNKYEPRLGLRDALDAARLLHSAAALKGNDEAVVEWLDARGYFS